MSACGCAITFFLFLLKIAEIYRYRYRFICFFSSDSRSAHYKNEKKENLSRCVGGKITSFNTKWNL